VGSGSPPSSFSGSIEETSGFFLRRRTYHTVANTRMMSNRGIAMPMPILPPVERLLEPDPAVATEVRAVEENVELVVAVLVIVIPMISVIAAEFGSVKVDVKGLSPDGIVVVFRNVVKTTVSVTA
jgi:hypothetical protein